MHEVMMDGWGNPSSPHVVGRRAKEMLEDSRAAIAGVLGVDADEIFFTSGSTEASSSGSSSIEVRSSRSTASRCITCTTLVGK